MAGSYTLYLDDPFGARLMTLDRFISFTYTLSTNAVGALELVLPGDFDSSLLGEDYRIEVWRSVDGQDAYLEGDQHWLIRKVEWVYPAREASYYTVTAVSALDIVRRRIVAYYSGSSFTFKIGTATAQIANLVAENTTTIDLTYRDPRTGGAAQTLGTNLTGVFAVAPVAESAILIGKTCARDNLLTTIQDIANTSTQGGQYVAFDVVWNGTILTFQTYLDQRGSDRRFPGSTNPVLLSPSFGSIADMTYTRDYTDEVTVGIGGGPGEASAREIQVAYDTERVTMSPFNRIETLVVATQATSDAALLDAASSAVRAKRPRIRIAGRLQQTAGVQYGRDWFWGDYLTASDDTTTFDVRVDAVKVTFERGEETIEAWLRGEL